MKVFISLILVFLIYSNAFAQTDSDSLSKVYYEKAKEKINAKDFDGANLYFKKIFRLKTTLPDELAYYYGLTLVHLQQYAKGKEALDKYLELTGEKGVFKNETGLLLKEAEKYICSKCSNKGSYVISDTCAVCEGDGKRETDCEVCKGRGMEFCQVCGGRGVLITPGNFGSQYSTCHHCAGGGYKSCRVCSGTRKKMIYCSECKGKGFFKRTVNCPH